MMKNQLLRQVRPFFDQLAHEQLNHLPPATKLLVAVSGGADSLALLHVLKTLYPPDSLVVAHVNHQLRPSADEEANFVRETTASWHIPCHVKKIDVAAWAAAHKQSLEEAGRTVRYQYFAELAEQVGANTVVVAHHADDQAETVLMHVIRGSGLAGLRGMLPISYLQGERSLLLLRPFLHITRTQIEAYCQQHHLQPIVDESNTDTTYFRNRLRHELLPMLETYNPQIKNRLQYLAAVVAADYELLAGALQEAWTAVCHNQASDMIQLKRTDWLNLPLGLRRGLLRQAVQQLRPSWRDISFTAIEQARHIVEKGHSGAQASLPGDLVLVVGYHFLTITADPHHIPTDLPQLPDNTPIRFPIPGQVQLANNWTLTASLLSPVDLAEIEANRNPWLTYLAVNDIDEPWLIRPRAAGERLRPLGMAGHTIKLKKLMINRKIPAYLRDRWPLVVQRDQLLWVVGHHQDERGRVTENAGYVVQLHCTPQ
jgi:tRNA(Ile)-lysidine synthase